MRQAGSLWLSKSSDQSSTSRWTSLLQGCKEAFSKLTAMIQGLRGDGLEPEVLISNLEYVQDVLGVLAQKAE